MIFKDRDEWLDYCDERNKFKKKRVFPVIRLTPVGWIKTGRMLRLPLKPKPFWVGDKK